MSFSRFLKLSHSLSRIPSLIFYPHLSPSLCLCLSPSVCLCLTLMQKRQLQSMKREKAVDNVCYEWQRMQTVSYKCGNRYVPYDGEFVRHLVIQDGVAETEALNTMDISGCDSEVCMPPRAGFKLFEIAYILLHCTCLSFKLFLP
jgi:hypothetical protein